MKAAAPGLNTCEYMKHAESGNAAIDSTIVVDGSLEGGSLGVVSDSTWAKWTKTVFQVPKTGKWAIAFRAKFPAITVSKSAYAGLINAASSHLVGVGAVQSVSATKWTLQIVGAGSTNATSTSNANTSLHDFMLTFDGTTLSLYVDGTLEATQTTLTNLTDEGMAIGTFASSSLTPGVVIQQLDYCYVSPIALLFDNAAAFQSAWQGFNAVTMGFSHMPEAAGVGLTPALAAIDDQRVVDSGNKIARTWTGIDWSYASFPSTAGGYTWNSTHMAGLYSWLDAMKAGGVKVMLTTSWSFIVDLCSAPIGSCTPTPTQEATWAHWVSDLFDQLINVRGYTNVIGTMLFTEPNQSGATPPVGYTLAQYYAHLATIVRDQIVADDGGRTPIRPRVLIVGPQEHHTDSNDAFIQYMVANAPDVLDVYTSHSYSILTWQQYVDRFTIWSGHASPSSFWSDEFNYLGSDPDIYRWSSDNGIFIARGMAAHAWAGAASSFLWMFQDQKGWPIPTIPNNEQHYGVLRYPGISLDPYPSWWMYSTIANLMGGGQGDGGAWSKLHRGLGQTSTLHALGASIPKGVKNCTDAAGCYSFMVVNEGSTPAKIGWDMAAPTSKTFYRYVYNAESPPRPRADNAAYLLPWDSTSVGGSTASTIPAHSVVVYSDMNIAAPRAVSLSSSATASASTSASPVANLNDLNTTHVSGPFNVWQPVSGSPGAQWAQLTWGTPATFDRIEVDMVGTLDPLYTADYTTNAHPAQQTTYTLKWWDGSAWQDFSPPVNVTNNAQNHRAHTFATVTSTAVRLNVPDASAAPITEIGVFYDPASVDTSIRVYGFTDPATTSGNEVVTAISTTAYTFQAGDTIRYRTRLLDKKAAMGGLDVTFASACGGALSTLDGATWKDQNAVAGAPTADLSSRAYEGWYSRTLAVPACAIGAASTNWAVVTARTDRVTASYGDVGTAFYDDIEVRHGDGSLAATIYSNGAADTVRILSSTSYLASEVDIAPNS